MAVAAVTELVIGDKAERQSLEAIPSAREVQETLSRHVRVPTGESDCDYFLPPVVAQHGIDFLIYATVREGRVIVNRCLGSSSTT
jgi:hypothetical protein